MQKFIPVLARLLLAQIFLVAIIIQLSIFMKTPGAYEQFQAFLGQQGLPGIVAPLMVLIQLLAGAALFLGLKTRVAAYVLAVYSVFIAFALRFNEPIIFMQYLAIAGGLLAIASLGSTPCSLDNLKKSA